MENSHQSGDFKILKEHENCGVTFLRTTELVTRTQAEDENLIFSDFKQGSIGNCGLIASLATISQRPEFLEEIAPKIEQTSDGLKLHFKMFHEGNPIIVTIDDALPFDENNCLIYARSLSSIEFLSRHSDLLQNYEDLESSSISGYTKFSNNDLTNSSPEDRSVKYEKNLGINKLFLVSFF